jgi:uncharacterized protein with von Willebrand factor type A (vWA) domain
MDGDPLDALLGFVAGARRAGVPASPDRVQAFAQALAETGDLYWAGRLTLCGCPEDIAHFEEAFRAWRLGLDSGRERPKVTGPPSVPRQIVVPFGVDGGDEREVRGTNNVTMLASRHELLRVRDLTELSTLERDEVRRLLALLRPVTPSRPGRRRTAYPRGDVDPQRTLRSTLRALGEPARLARRHRRDRPRRLVLLIDVSGSMAPYADALLRFAHAAVRCRPQSTEVFTLGTRLTRVTKALRTRDPDAALAAAGAAILDWSGGTRLGDGLAAFVARYAHPGLARRATVVVFSDGWERGDTTALAQAAARLRRLVHRLVWVSPHQGKPGFAPTTGGLVAVLPHLDALVAGHSLAALTELVDTLQKR